jgi:hypothetical protein
MNAYQELKQKQDKEFGEFPIFFAFNNEQFEEGMAKLGLTKFDTNQIYKFGTTGGFYRRTDSERLHEMLTRFEKELQDAIDADPTGEGFILEMFGYELADHEYIVSYDTSETLAALGLTPEDIEKDQRLQHGLKLAKQRQREKYAEE